MLVHLDADLAIVDKEAGLLSVPTEDQQKTSAIELLARYLNDARGEATRRRFFGKADAVKPLPVHRLDQYTSGLICVAMNPAARAHLISQLRAHTFLREYIAYADGCAEAQKGSWRNFLRLDTHPGTLKSLKKKGGKVPYGQLRQALHAASIGVQHPTQGDTRLFHSNVPGDLQQLEQRLSASTL